MLLGHGFTFQLCLFLSLFNLSYIASSFRMALLNKSSKRTGCIFCASQLLSQEQHLDGKCFLIQSKEAWKIKGPTPCAVIRSPFFCSFIIRSSPPSFLSSSSCRSPSSFLPRFFFPSFSFLIQKSS